MTEWRPLPEHNRYEIVAVARGEVPIYYEEFGSYQGDWVLVGRGESGISLYKGHFGSCSGCDAYEATEPKSWAVAKRFAADYDPFAVIPLATMRNLCRERTLKEALPRNLRGGADDADDDESYSELPSLSNLANWVMLAVKVDQGWPVEVADIASATNQELRHRALRAYGYERWVADVGGVVVHEDGENQLVRAGEVLFVSVKDASTDRRYLLRVPPGIVRVRHAIAWTFGLEEFEYAPVVET